MAIILNDYFDYFITKFGEIEHKYYFQRKRRVFLPVPEIDPGDGNTIEVPHLNEKDLFKEYPSIRGIHYDGIDGSTALLECRAMDLECAAEYGYDDEMEDYARNRVLNLMPAWIGKNEIENVKVSYNKYDMRQEQLARLGERGPCIMTNEVMKRIKEFKAAQIQDEANDEAAYLNFINNK